MNRRTYAELALVFTGSVALCVAACSDSSDDASANGPSGKNGANVPGVNGKGDGDGGADGSTDPSKPKSGWDYAKVGGGGFVTGGSVAADGTKFFRTDTSGGYLYDDASGVFRQVIPNNIPAEDNTYWNGTGVFEVMIAGSDSKTMFAAYVNALYKSTDGGATFTKVKADLSFESNGGNMRTLGRHGQVDPQNPQHVLFGDQTALWRSTDGGATWNKATGVSAAGSVNGDTAGFSGIAFNPKSTLANGRSSEAIVSTGGKFFRTTNGGDSFSEISSGGPNDAPQEGEFDGKGRYFVSTMVGGGVWRWSGGTWKDLGITGSFDTTFFIDPENDDHIVVNRAFDLAWSESTTGGDSWAAEQNWETVIQKSVDGITWHGEDPHYFSANILLDTAHKTLWMPGGNQGVASIPLANLKGKAPFTADIHGKGIEQICFNVMVAPKGSKKLYSAVWDESYAELDRDNASYPSKINDVGGLAASWGIAGSKENPKMLARWLSGPVAKSGWTDDGGDTWHPFAKLPAGITDSSADWGYGGTIAYSGADNIIVVSSNTNGGGIKMPYYTLDRGATWKPVTLPTPWTSENVAGVHFAYYLNREILVADATKLGRFYFLVNASDENFRGIYRTDDGGATWEQASKGFPGAQGLGSWGYNAHIESPVENHLFIGGGAEGTEGQMDSGQLFRSTDGGETFTPLPDVNEPGKFGFGAPAHPGGYPVLFMEGYYKGKPGVWMSPDADKESPTWISLGAAPNGVYVHPSFITGDPDIPGRVWVATSCAGAQFGEFGDLLK